jgi:hypothetical protein
MQGFKIVSFKSFEMRRIHVFQQYFRPPDRIRRAEIDYCVYRNSSQPCFSYYLLTESRDTLPPVLNSKQSLSIIPGYDKRLTYFDWLELIEKLISVAIIDIGDWAILLNSDIFADQTLARLPSVNSSCRNPQIKFFLACTRHCFYGVESDPNPQMLQDAWGIQAIQNILPHNKYCETKISLGMPGCDNRIASIFKSAGYFPLNLAYHIRFTHVHRSPHRSYSENDRIKGTYTFVHPVPSFIPIESISSHAQFINSLASNCDAFLV